MCPLHVTHQVVPVQELPVTPLLRAGVLEVTRVRHFMGDDFISKPVRLVAELALEDLVPGARPQVLLESVLVGVALVALAAQQLEVVEFVSLLVEGGRLLLVVDALHIHRVGLEQLYIEGLHGLEEAFHGIVTHTHLQVLEVA